MEKEKRKMCYKVGKRKERDKKEGKLKREKSGGAKLFIHTFKQK